MGDLLNSITEFLGGIWDSPAVQLGIRAIGLYIVILWLAGAYWAFRDMQLRTSNPILPYFAAGLIIIFTPVFFIFAIIAYRVVRPQEKIGEVYERTLAEEALLAEVESVKSCPTCARRVNEEWIICPTCRTRLNRVCPNCSRLVGLDWSLCAWCGRDFERAATGFEAIPAPRQAAPSADQFTPRPATAALELTAYRDPAAGAAVAAAGVRDTGPRDVSRQPAPGASASARPSSQPVTGPSASLSTWDTPTGSSRSLDRTPAPPTATRTVTPSPTAPSGTTRPAQPGKTSGKGTRTSTDPLPEH